MRRNLIPILVAILILGVLGFLTYNFFISKTPVLSIPNNLTSQKPTTNSETSPNNPNAKLFLSETLKVQFSYNPNYENTSFSVKETENKIYVYMSTTKAEDGQYLEVFTKDANDSLETAIQKKFLVGYNSTNCFVETIENKDGTGMAKAIISYPPPSDPDEPFFANSDKCPAVYSQSNGISYFLYDKNFPDKFLFVSIGQYGIKSGVRESLWQQTIKFIR